MLIKLLTAYIDDSSDKIIIDGLNVSHHFSRLSRNNKVNFGFSRYVDNSSGRFIDRLTLDLATEFNAPKEVPSIVKLFDDTDEKVDVAVAKKEKEFDKERKLFNESKSLLNSKILELENKIKELSEAKPEDEKSEKKSGRPPKKTEDLV